MSQRRYRERGQIGHLRQLAEFSWHTPECAQLWSLSRPYVGNPANLRFQRFAGDVCRGLGKSGPISQLPHP